MRDIVATIQADQYHLIARDPEPPLVIQGGPGTGKTAVGLHRASFLLYAHRERLRRVLVVGPNPAFMEYVSHVLPTLGEDSVDQRAVAELVPGVELTRVDPPDVQRLKADTRLGEVVRRAAELASDGEPQELVVRLEGRFVGVEADEVAELLDEARAELGLTAAARERFRMNVLRRFYEDYGVRLGGQAFRELRRGRARAAPGRAADAVPRRELAGAEAGAGRAPAARVADRYRGRRRRARRGRAAAPAPRAQRLERGRPAAARRGARGAGRGADPLRARDRGRGAGPDADAAADGRAPRRRLVHAARRHRAGDRPGPLPTAGTSCCRTSRAPRAREVEELRHAYRVPREIMELALPLLEQIAPEVEPPVAYRVGAERPRVVEADAPLPAAFEEAARLAGEEGLLAVIAPASLRGEGEAALFDDSRIAVLTPREAKGMEFDHVIVVEPAQIVEEAVEGQGLRELYVALTRPTTTLVLVHARPLPPELGL